MLDCFSQKLVQTRSAYFLDGWLKFNEEKWGYKAERVRYTLPGKELPALEGVLYLTKNGKVRMPPCNAYLPLQFFFTATEKNCQLYSQYLSLFKLLAEDISKRGVDGTICFPPGFIDARAFQWLGYDVTFAYTFVGKLPYCESELDTSVRKNIRKAEKAAYTVTASIDWDMVLLGLNKTAEFKNFDNILTAMDLKKCDQFLGDDILKAHVALTSDGDCVASQVKFAMPNGLCIDWLAGNDREHINYGINQLLYAKALSDVAATGTKYFDYCGANIEPVARAKAAWGFPLVPYIVLRDHSVKGKAKQLLGHIHGLRTVYHSVRGKFHGSI